MEWWGNFVNRVRAGWAAFNGKALVPSYESPMWDLYASRMFRYAHADAYVSNTVYTSLVTYAAMHKAQAGLYKHTRGIYNPSQRLVETYVAKVYGGMLDLNDMTSGAIPIDTDNALLKDAVRQLWKWSNWGTNKSLFVRYGASYGDMPLKVVDDRAAGKVRLEVLHPSRIKDAEFDEVGNVKRVVIEYEREDETLTTPTGQMRKTDTHTYTEVIDKNSFETYRDGEAYAYYTDADGNPIKRWPNEYGFVPLVIGKHCDTGLQWGANAFLGSLRKIDEINDAASLLNDQVRKAVNVIYYYSGVQSQEELDVSVDEKDEIPAIYGPADSQPHPMIAPIDIAAASANIEKMLAELERDMPELALHRLRESANASGVAVRIMYGDAIDRIVEARGNYDDALVRAQMMAISIGGFNRYDGFESFTLGSYDAGDLQHFIGDRPVIKDSIDQLNKLTIMQSSGAPASAIWSELGFSDDVIRQWELEKEAARMINAQQNPPLDGNTPPQLPDGTQPPTGEQPTQRQPAVRGSKLPSDQAKKVASITPNELSKIAANSRRNGGG